MKTIYMAGGCFWGVEKAFNLLDGVVSTTCGYVNGKTSNPTYQQVCKGDTGFKECVKVDYDETKISLDTLLQAFFLIIHPEMKDRQGNDIGSQYQSGVYYTNQEDETFIKQYFEQEKKKHPAFYTECQEMDNFYDAEDYHQDYLVKNPNGYCHVPFTQYAKIEALNSK